MESFNVLPATRGFFHHFFSDDLENILSSILKNNHKPVGHVEFRKGFDTHRFHDGWKTPLGAENSFTVEATPVVHTSV